MKRPNAVAIDRLDPGRWYEITFARPGGSQIRPRHHIDPSFLVSAEPVDELTERRSG